MVHRLTIQSKIVGGEKDDYFDTRFVFDDGGENIKIID